MIKNVKKTKEELKEECAPVLYREIERFFAKGVLILVSDGLDILDVAIAVQNDDDRQMRSWIENEKVIRVTDEHALKWSETETALMAVTVVPWLLVQEII